MGWYSGTGIHKQVSEGKKYTYRNIIHVLGGSMEKTEQLQNWRVLHEIQFYDKYQQQERKQLEKKYWEISLLSSSNRYDLWYGPRRSKNFINQRHDQDFLRKIRLIPNHHPRRKELETKIRHFHGMLLLGLPGSKRQPNVYSNLTESKYKKPGSEIASSHTAHLTYIE